MLRRRPRRSTDPRPDALYPHGVLRHKSQSRESAVVKSWEISSRPVSATSVHEDVRTGSLLATFVLPSGRLGSPPQIEPRRRATLTRQLLVAVDAAGDATGSDSCSANAFEFAKVMTDQESTHGGRAQCTGASQRW